MPLAPGKRRKRKMTIGNGWHWHIEIPRTQNGALPKAGLADIAGTVEKPGQTPPNTRQRSHTIVPLQAFPPEKRNLDRRTRIQVY